MTSAAVLADIASDLEARRRDRRLVTELPIAGAQGPRVLLADGREVLNLCSNDYLGLAREPVVLEVAAAALREHGLGYAAGRIICGTAAGHLALESELSAFLGVDAALLFTSCFDANTGLFEALLGPDDVVVSDTLNHASIIDGIRLSKARRLTYPSRDVGALRSALEQARGARRRLVVTDGVFSMDGVAADLPAICDLAEELDALVVVDDSHGIGVLGRSGRGSVDEQGVAGRVDLVTGTFGKALGGAGGGFAAGRGPLVDLLRQSARPYVFSNALPPTTVEVARFALRELDRDEARRKQLLSNTVVLREALGRQGLEVLGNEHPIVPVMIPDAAAARAVAARLLEEGILVVALAHPVVAKGASRIRLQASAAHDPIELATAADVVGTVVREVS